MTSSLPCLPQDVEKELEMQISMKTEMEVALRLLEKDIHEKQDSVVALRGQLDEVKAINLELYNKLQVGQHSPQQQQQQQQQQPQQQPQQPTSLQSSSSHTQQQAQQQQQPEKKPQGKQ